MKSFARVSTVFALSVVLIASSQAQLRVGKLGFGVTGSMLSPMIDNVPATGPGSPSAGIAGGLSVVYSPWMYIGLKASAGVGDFSYKFAGANAKTSMALISGYATLNMMPNSSFNPFVGAGLGYHYYDARLAAGTALTNTKSSKPAGFDILAHGGFDYFFSEFISVTVSADYAIMQTDVIDGLAKGSKDSYLRAGLELRYYFFDQAFLTRMLEALKARYEK
jgi:hypothetical protein